MKFKKFISIILAVITVFCFASCGNTDKKNQTDLKNNATAKTKDTITLLYSAADGFNPYIAVSETNRHLLKLVFEPLVKIDNEFNAVYSVAKSVTVKDKICTVTIKDLKFSDGSKITPEDIVYSYNLAKKSKTGYKERLYNISSATAVSDNSVKFELKKQDIYCQNILTFPILKAESEKVTNTDGVVLSPIGSGRFKVNEAQNGLVENKNCTSYKGSIKKIKLIDAPDTESVAHYAQIGAADMYYSEISDGSITRMTGKKTIVNLNNMVYIGINQNDKFLKENLLRQAISTAIDRSVICQNAYFNNAVAATGFFNPVWSETKSVQNIQNKPNKEITIENLEKIGYNSLDSDGIRQNSKDEKLKFTLLVNSENTIKVSAAKLVAKQLSDFGISVTVTQKPYKDYLKDLKSGNFQLFMGEIKLTENMDISSMVTSGGSAAYGLVKSNKKADKSKEQVKNKDFEVIDGFYKGENSITDVATVLQNKMPFVPVCYRTATLFYNEKIENVNTASQCDIYFSIGSYIYY